MKIRTYTELCTFQTFEERYRYLRLGGQVGFETVGYDRVFMEAFYNSTEWKHIRRKIVLRDRGCDLGIEGRELQNGIFIHHMNPISIEDVERRSEILLNPEFLICCSMNTHNAIHYGDESLLIIAPVIRVPNDTCPWKQNNQGGIRLG